MNTKGTIFFDYDGTLHDTMRIYGPAFRAGYAWLVEQGYAQSHEFTDEWISRWLGWTIRDMWTTFMPELPEEVWRKASHIVGEEMNRIMSAGRAALFDGVTETLTELKAQGYDLVILSNCGKAYRDNHRVAFNLDQWFVAYYIAGEYPNLKKWEIYQQHAALNHPYPHVMVGDRFHDIEVATKTGIASVGCAFGFGDVEELNEATVIANQFSEIPTLLKQIL